MLRTRHESDLPNVTEMNKILSEVDFEPTAHDF